MKQTLIKITDDHYVVVDDSEIKEGDWMIRDGEQPTLVTHDFWWDFGVPYKKITHSTQPIETFNWMGNSEKGYDTIKPLSLQEIKELIGEVDVEKETITSSDTKVSIVMTDKQQTAVQWLRAQLAVTHSPEIIEWLWTKAFQMEREQIEAAYRADTYPCSEVDAEQYFTDTYQNKSRE